MRPHFLSSTRISHLALCRRKPKVNARIAGQAVVAPGLPSGAGVEQEAALLLGILFSAITPLGQRIFAYNVALLTSKAFQLL